ncbi:MAG: hypothetical protein QXI10_02360, partial [Candidatus Diapherotrites archaeon]
FELIINFKGIDFKKAENRIDLEVRLPHSNGKSSQGKVLAFIKDANFAEELKGKADKIIMDYEIPNLKKKDVDQLMIDYNIFVAEGPSMLTVGKYLGQILAPKGRMPKPIQTSIESFESAVKGTGNNIRVTNKKGKFMPVIHCVVGKESFNDSDIADNILEIYNSVVNVLPTKESNVKSCFVKLTMGVPVKIGAVKGEQND